MKLKLSCIDIWINNDMYPPISMPGPNIVNLGCMAMEKLI